jgi:hypothetical protein
MDASISATDLKQSLLAHGMVVYDALYAWCKQAK